MAQCQMGDHQLKKWYLSQQPFNPSILKQSTSLSLHTQMWSSYPETRVWGLKKGQSVGLTLLLGGGMCNEMQGSGVREKLWVVKHDSQAAQHGAN